MYASYLFFYKKQKNYIFFLNFCWLFQLISKYTVVYWLFIQFCFGW